MEFGSNNPVHKLRVAPTVRSAPTEPTPYWEDASSTCDAVPNDSLDVPANAKIFTTLLAAGDRIFDCSNGSVVDPGQSNAVANATSIGGDGWKGTQAYEGSVAGN
jgi:hypothetical protein